HERVGGDVGIVPGRADRVRRRARRDVGRKGDDHQGHGVANLAQPPDAHLRRITDLAKAAHRTAYALEIVAGLTASLETAAIRAPAVRDAGLAGLPVGAEAVPAELLGAQRAAVVRLQVLAVARLARIEDAVAADLQPADLAAPVAVPAVAVVALLRVVEVAVPADGGATAPEEGAPEEHREGERRP